MRQRLLAGFLLMCAAAALAAQAPPPVFRAGVDVVQVDVTVLDKDRKPVRGLTAADFTVFEDGKPRSIVAFTPVELPAAAPVAAGDTASWTRDVAPDVTTNAVPEEGRLFVILFDWSIRFEDQQSARKIATAAVNQLGPGDEAAVIFSSGFANAGTPQGFTSDRARLLDVINRPMAPAMHEPDTRGQDARNANKSMIADPEGYESGDCHCRVCVMDAVAHAADLLRDVPNRRKSLLFIGTYFQGYELPFAFPPPPPGPPPIGAPDAPIDHGWNWGTCSQTLQDARARMQRATGLANVTVHVLDPGGQASPGNEPLGGGPTMAAGHLVLNPVGTAMKRLDDLHIMPDMTGGRTVLNTNSPEEAVPAIFQESQSYYLLAVERGAQVNDGKLHDLEVKVNRPGTSVRYRNGYYATDALAVATAPPSEVPLSKALDALLPRADVPLAVTAEPFATPGASQPAAVGLVIAVREPAVAAGGATANANESETVLAALFDAKGQSAAKASETITVTLPPSSKSDVTYDVLTRLPAAPGRYEVRAGVDIGSDRRGTVSTYVDVPDFAKEPVSLSGIALGTTPRRPTAAADLLKDVLPIVPTARRKFTAYDRVTSFVHIYQGGSGALAPIALFVRIVDVHGKAMFDDTVALGVQNFSASRAADYQTDLPLTRLTPGEYLMTVRAARGSATAERAVRFSVAPAPEMEAEAPSAAPSPAAAASAAALASVLRAAGAYLDHYATDLASVVSEEFYEQRVLSPSGAYTMRSSRSLRSDVIVVPDEERGWVMFRDVFEVDGAPVRDRDDRLAKLFVTPSANAWEQARRLIDESARFNLGTFGVPQNRTLNVPMVTLLFFRTPYQRRSQFTVNGEETVNGTRAVIVAFEEQATPRILGSPGGVPMAGRAWIDPGSGCILRTELKYRTAVLTGVRTDVTIRTQYGLDSRLGIWTPTAMDEDYEVSAPDFPSEVAWPSLVAHATYSNYHRFNVDTTETTRQK